jgi:nicotinate phosphoribosyltransferase
LPRFNIATEQDILRGKTSDIYFQRTLEILKKEKRDRVSVLGEVTTHSLPDAWAWGVLSGVEEAVRLLEGKPVDLWSLPEGSLFTPKTASGIPTPVMTVEGPYGAFGLFETPMLGLLCQASGITTKAARVRKLAGDKRIISFGVRRMHPGVAPMIERSVYIGGLDDVTTPLGAERLGLSPVGTMPHALTIVMGGPREAFEAMQKHLEKKIPRIALVDTYYDEKIEANIAAEAIPDLAGVRIDTHSTRRGNLASIVREVRWELDIRGHKDAKLYVSGGISEEKIPELLEAGVDGFGIGTSLSNAPTIDFAFDIVEMEGKPVAKRGKFGGRKRLMRCVEHGCYEVDVRECPGCKGEVKPAMVQYLRKGRLMRKLPAVKEIRKRVLDEMKYAHFAQ